MATSLTTPEAACATCWCKDVEIPAAVLDRVPANARGSACICAACCNAGMDNPVDNPTLATGVTKVLDPGGREAVQLEAGGQRVLIAMTGAQVLSWHTGIGEQGESDVLWTASEPKYESHKPVRGGVPVVFPWFGDHATDATKPAHGFARSLDWQLAASAAAEITLECRDSDQTSALWDHAFRLQLRIALGSTEGSSLRIEMKVENTSAQAFSFEQALHTYFATGDIQQASVHGLENVPFVEHAREPIAEWDPSQPIRFGAETDRVFQGVPDRIELRASALQRAVRLQTNNARSAIVWNPWPNKTARLSQMHTDDWRSFCCIESANVGDNRVELSPGESHTMTLKLSAARAR